MKWVALGSEEPFMPQNGLQVEFSKEGEETK